jgi:hypothetical protein
LSALFCPASAKQTITIVLVTLILFHFKCYLTWIPPQAAFILMKGRLGISNYSRRRNTIIARDDILFLSYTQELTILYVFITQMS